MLDVLITILLVLTVFILIILFFSYISLKGETNIMHPHDAKFMKRKLKTGSIDVHPTEKALILNYELEFQILGEKHEEICKDKKNLEKIITLPTLNSKTDCGALSKAIMEKCELIHPSKLAEIEQLVYYLKGRRGITRTDSNVSRSGSAASVKSISNGIEPSAKSEGANILQVDDYVELLYEGIGEKIKGSAQILSLARVDENLDILSKNESVLSALSRILREDWKKSIVLSTNLVYTFYCFSQFNDFHALIAHYKIGSLCMDILDFELSRYDDWKEELLETETSPTTDKAESKIVRKTCPNSASMSEIPRSKIPEPVRPRSGNWADAYSTQKSIMNGSVYDDWSSSSDQLEDRNKQLSEAERAKRYRTLIKKQEQLLRVAFFLLLNISEDEIVEEKMVKKNIVGMLIKTLEREDDDLLILVLTFLKKLSIFEVNKDMMAELDIIDKLPRILMMNNVELVYLTLKLLFNLSFDVELRNKMIKRGFLQKCVSFLSDDRHQTVVIKLLYHFSQDDKVKAMFSQTDCVALMTDMMLLCRDDHKEMTALAINLALNKSNAEQMIENNRLHNLMSRAFKSQNYLLMKVIRNISEHKSLQTHFVEFVGDLAKALTDSKQEEFVQECIGVLGNLNLSDLDYNQIFEHFKLIPFFKNLLKPNTIEDDFLLDIVVFLGTAAGDKECAALMGKSELIRMVVDQMKVHQEDDEIIYQIIYIFYQVLQHKEAKDFIILDTEIPGFLIDLAQDTNKIVSKICDSCLDLISKANVDWGRRIQIEQFRTHNTQWLQMIESNAADDIEEEEDTMDVLPPYLNAEFLATHSVPIVSDLDPIPVANNTELTADSPELLDEMMMNRFLHMCGLRQKKCKYIVD